MYYNIIIIIEKLKLVFLVLNFHSIPINWLFINSLVMVKKAKLIHSYIQPNCSLSHLHVRSSRFTNNYEHEIYFSKIINSFQYLKTARPLCKTKLTYLTWNIYHSGLLFSNISILKSVGHFLFWQHSKTNKTIDILDSYMYYTLRIFIWNNWRF